MGTAGGSSFVRPTTRSSAATRGGQVGVGPGGAGGAGGGGGGGVAGGGGGVCPVSGGGGMGGSGLPVLSTGWFVWLATSLRAALAMLRRAGTSRASSDSRLSRGRRGELTVVC